MTTPAIISGRAPGSRLRCALTLAVLLGLHLPGHATASDRLPPSEPAADVLGALRVGHWVEVRGQFVGPGNFLAQRVDAIEPRSFPRLWGVAEPGSEPGTLVVLGHSLALGEDAKVTERSEGFAGRRVRLQGTFGAQRTFYVRSISARSPGLDRILGRVGSVRSTTHGGLRLNLHGFDVEVPAAAETRSEGPVAMLNRTSPTQLTSSYSSIEDIDDLLGDGFQLGRNLGLRLRQDVSTTSRRNYELDNQDDRDIDPDDDLDDAAHSLRFQLAWTPSSRTTVLLDARHRLRHRDVRGEADDDSDLRLNEAWLLVRDVGWGIDLQVGRTDHDDPREWLYDQNLDGLRFFKTTARTQWDLSLSTTLDGSSLDESATNAILYVANRRGPRHLAGYIVHRRFGDGRDLERSHVGARVLGPASRRIRFWGETSLLIGSHGGNSLRGWAADLGATIALDERRRTRLTAAFAKASGDRSGGTITEFRQTGLHDNDARLGGLAAVRYYGELFDPELSNLEVTTLAIARELVDDVSLELIGHTYRQSIPDNRVRSDIDQRPNGIEKDLGWELDLVLAFRRFRRWDVEIVGSHFEPGSAFPGSESARLGRIQIRYRY